MESFIQSLPKAELHLHIEGTLEPELMLTFAKRNAIAAPFASVSHAKKAYSFSDLQSFLDIYYTGLGVLQTADDFYDLTMAYLQRAFQENVKHAEIFFDPQAHMVRSVSFATCIRGICGALRDGQAEFGITSKLIMCFLRHLSEESAFEVLDASLPFRDSIWGVGLDSSEHGHPPEKFRRVFCAARDYGFGAVAHAGEEGPAEYIWQALDILKVQRIDHGVNCSHDSKLVARLLKEGIPLTVCPLSNIKLKVFNHLKDHNFKELFDKGLCVTLNSDDPAYFGGYINANYTAVQQQFKLSSKEMVSIAKNSFQASFLSSAEKQRYFAILDQM